MALKSAFPNLAPIPGCLNRSVRPGAQVSGPTLVFAAGSWNLLRRLRRVIDFYERIDQETSRLRPKLKITERNRVYDGWSTLDVVTVETLGDDGVTRRHEREVLDHGPVVAVLAYDPDRRQALLARQWRVPLLLTGDDPFLLEACAGLIDAGETPAEAAIREAEEELGLHLEAVRKVGEVFPSPGALTEKMHLFLATYGLQDRKSDGGGLDHEGEDIEIVEMPLDALFDMAGAGAINDAKTLILVQMLILQSA
jgi:nudix-type nucleoside diphosphatase (YffH/AdpP family)